MAPNPWRRTALKVEGQPQMVDTGGTLEIHNVGSDRLYLGESANTDAPEQMLEPGETVTVTSRRFLWSPGRARVQIREYARERVTA